MKSLLKNLSCLLIVMMSISMFTSCTKDGDISDLTTTQEPTETNSNTPNNNPTTTLLALGQTGQMENDSMDLCDCFALFDSVDWNASPTEIEAQVEAILATLTEAQIEELFTPVCTPDGEIYINACAADCNGATNYEECEGDDFCDDFDGYCDNNFEDCFTINYPISLLLNDGTTVTANSDEELEDIFEAWEMGNTSLPEPQVIFPFDVTVDNATVSITNEDEFEDLLESCDFNNGHHDEFELCFDFVYPLTIVFPDASTATVNDEDELWDTVENWYVANPTNDEDPTLQYPANVLLEDGTTATINNDDELDDLIESCFNFELDDCFSLIYPIEVLFPDGSTAATNSDDELFSTVDDWYDANPNSMEDPTLVFPIQVELEDGTIETIENEDELDDLFEDCYGNWGGCFVTGDSSNALSKSGSKINISKRN